MLFQENCPKSPLDDKMSKLMQITDRRPFPLRKIETSAVYCVIFPSHDHRFALILKTFKKQVYLFHGWVRMKSGLFACRRISLKSLKLNIDFLDNP